MSKLLLSCHLGINHELERDPPSAPFVFQRVTQTADLSTPAVTLSYHIDKVSEIYEGDHNTVYRALLLGHESGGQRSIVLKTDVNARYPRSAMFSQEALRYEKDLTRLQGTHIPCFYGLFQATMYDKLVSVLLLEDCGESINLHDHKSLSHSDKVQIFKLFTKLHGSRFAHHDFAGRNIVKNQDGKFFLLDLEHSTPHKCEARLTVLFGDFAPGREAFGCPELYDVAIALDFWLPANLNFYGSYVPVGAIQEGKSRDLVALIPSHMLRTQEDRDNALRHAEEMIEDVQGIQKQFAMVPDEQRYSHPSYIPKGRSTSKPPAPA
ncbi:hypothetical protein B0H34DRAFT_861830 [Crassisporium funariophilum]|nr:hypothetical protein B0H34DRAFT_861830 [Crassisporium funariophilum]